MLSDAAKKRIREIAGVDKVRIVGSMSPSGYGFALRWHKTDALKSGHIMTVNDRMMLDEAVAEARAFLKECQHEISVAKKECE